MITNLEVNMPLFLAVILFCITSNVYSAKETSDFDPAVFLPADTAAVWQYKFYKKNSAAGWKNITARILYTEEYNGNFYYCYASPAEHIKNLIRVDGTGAYIRQIKYPLPFLNFLHMDVDLEPEVQFMKFPLYKNEEWESDTKGLIKSLGLFTFTVDIKVKFHVISISLEKSDGKNIRTVKIKTVSKIGNGVREESEQWYGENVGYIMEDNKDYRLVLDKFEPGRRQRPH
jgi:hypothetical protein